MQIKTKKYHVLSNIGHIFYFFRAITFTAEWWMYIAYAILLLIIDYNSAIKPIQMGLIAYSMHYPLYYTIKNIIKFHTLYPTMKHNIYVHLTV